MLSHEDWQIYRRCEGSHFLQLQSPEVTSLPALLSPEDQEPKMFRYFGNYTKQCDIRNWMTLKAPLNGH